VVKIHPKTLQDLEFPTVLQQVALRCNTELGKERAMETIPFPERELAINSLKKTSEYLSSFINENRIPNHGFDIGDVYKRQV